MNMINFYPINICLQASSHAMPIENNSIPLIVIEGDRPDIATFSSRSSGNNYFITTSLDGKARCNCYGRVFTGTENYVSYSLNNDPARYETLYYDNTIIITANPGVTAKKPPELTIEEEPVVSYDRSGSRLTIDLKDVSPNADIEIITVDGVSVLNIKKASKRLKLDTHPFLSGTYIVRITKENIGFENMFFIGE
ncbi:MAG: T9SS type A sorting domain-containing protein [Chitinivibrionales bacterium]|nr:T9SS type A sorting domain-containing protein [Chitinivibrionales bacterium]